MAGRIGEHVERLVCVVRSVERSVAGALARIDPGRTTGRAAGDLGLRQPALAPMHAALDGRDPLARPWLTAETFAAARAART